MEKIISMSRTIRKSKWGNTYNDGKENYKCKCTWCTKEDKKKAVKKALDLEIKNTINRIYGE
jgi:hypothetical protein